MYIGKEEWYDEKGGNQWSKDPLLEAGKRI